MTPSALGAEAADANSRWHMDGHGKPTPTDAVEADARDRERGLLAQISDLADRVRHLRRTDAVMHQVRIKTLSDDLRGKWDEMRALRAPPVSADVSLRRHGHYD